MSVLFKQRSFPTHDSMQHTNTVQRKISAKSHRPLIRNPHRTRNKRVIDPDVTWLGGRNGEDSR